jgi:photosystem II stability/assembly factor-like uncharacterized protein
MGLKTMLATVVVALIAAAPASAGGIAWTPLTTGTTENVMSLSYRSDAALFFGTDRGHIYHERADGSGADPATLSPAAVTNTIFYDIAFSPSGTVGLAVGTAGTVYRTADGGSTWTQVTLPPVPATCGSSSTTTDAQGDALRTIAFRSDSVAWIGGEYNSSDQEPPLYKTTDGGQHFADINRTTSPCLIDGYNIRKIIAVPGTSTVQVLAGFSGGDGLYTSTDDLQTATRQPGFAEVCGHREDSLAIDTANPLHLFASGPCMNTFGLRASDNGSTFHDASYVGATQPSAIEALAAAGGVALGVGVNGELWAMHDTTTAYYEPVTGAQAASWNAVQMASAKQAVIGGQGGHLLRTTNADALPDPTPPPSSGGQTPPPPVPPAPVETKPATTIGVPGGKLTLTTPSSCVPASSTFTAVVKLRRAHGSAARRRGAVLAIRRVTVTIDGGTPIKAGRTGRVAIVVGALPSRSIHQIVARVTAKVRGSRKLRTFTIKRRFVVC